MAYKFTYIGSVAAMGPTPNLPPSIAWNKLGLRQQDRIDNGEDSGSAEPLEALWFKLPCRNNNKF